MPDSSAASERTSQRPPCLLILPLGFYGFGRVLRRELEARGFDVVMENDEFPANVIGKLLGKLGALGLLRWFTLKVFRKRYQRADRFSTVIIVKGRGVGRELIGFLKSISDRVVAYNFDSFRFNPSPLAWLKDVERYCTFDPVDARNYNLPLVHLFSAIEEATAPVTRRYDLTILMKNHSQRLAYMDQVLSALSDRSRFIYIFEPNLFSFALGMLRTPRLYYKYWEDIHFRPLPYEGFVRVLCDSRLTIDYAHPSQTGLTIRCFEARSVGVSIVSNNPHVFTHPDFDAHTVVHFPLGGNRFRLAADVRRLVSEPSSPSVRTVADFMSELLGAGASTEATTLDESRNVATTTKVGEKS